jgi:hypothetical protein
LADNSQHHNHHYGDGEAEGARDAPGGEDVDSMSRDAPFPPA